MFQITEEWLKEKQACAEGMHWFLNQKHTALDQVVKALIKDQKYNWANWVYSNLFDKPQSVYYACFSAKLSLKYFEKQYPKDKRPRLAIEAALNWAKHPTKKNRSAAESAVESAAESAWSAAESAVESAAWSARSAAWSAAESAAWKKILLYGLKLLLTEKVRGK